jgi:hypothetical protein
MENENLDAFFMSDKQLMKILVALSEDTCMIEFIGHMRIKDGESVVRADGLPWIVFGKNDIDEKLFQSLVDETEWTKWLVKEFQGPGTYCFRAIVKLSPSVDDNDHSLLEGYVSHGEVELIITEEEERSNREMSLDEAFRIIQNMKIKK